MFKKHSFNVKLVRDEPKAVYTDHEGNSTVITNYITADQATALITHAGTIAVKTYMAIKVVKTVGSIAEIIAKSAFK